MKNYKVYSDTCSSIEKRSYGMIEHRVLKLKYIDGSEVESYCYKKIVLSYRHRLRLLLGMEGQLPNGRFLYSFMKRLFGYPIGKKIYKADEEIFYDGRWPKLTGKEIIKRFAGWFDLYIYSNLLRFL